MTPEELEAALIMRDYTPKTLGDIAEIARGRLEAGEIQNLAGPDACKNAHVDAVVDAHYKSLRQPAYRAAAGLMPLSTPQETTND